MVAGPGDHFILRMLSPVQTIGGGMIVEAVPQPAEAEPAGHVTRTCGPGPRRSGDERRFVEYCVRTAPALAADPAGAGRAGEGSGGPVTGDSRRVGRRKEDAPIWARLYVHRDTAAESAARILGSSRSSIANRPKVPGIPPEQLRQACQFDKTVSEGWWPCCWRKAGLSERNQRLALPGHQADGARRAGPAVRGGRSRCFATRRFIRRGWRRSSPQRAARRRPSGKASRSFASMGGWCDRRPVVPPRGRGSRQEILIEFLRKEGRLESVRFKYLLDTARKYALPLLDYFDRIGVTRRTGNTRYLRTRPGQE